VFVRIRRFIGRIVRVYVRIVQARVVHRVRQGLPSSVCYVLMIEQHFWWGIVFVLMVLRLMMMGIVSCVMLLVVKGASMDRVRFVRTARWSFSCGRENVSARHLVAR
jgi:hypothetical protein